MEQCKITVHAFSTQDRVADLLTKPLVESDFCKLKQNHGAYEDNYSTNMQVTVRKHEVKMRTPEHDRTNEKQGTFVKMPQLR